MDYNWDFFAVAVVMGLCSYQFGEIIDWNSIWAYENTGPSMGLECGLATKPAVVGIK